MIKNLFQTKKTVYSLEVFPPKKDSDITTIYKALDSFRELKPDFISVTYGAGGSTSRKTLEIASYIQNHCKVEAVAHLTCAALNEESLQEFLDQLKANKVKNVLALRGDMPKDMTEEQFNSRTFPYAADLIRHILKNPFGTIAGACYPEAHPQSVSQEADISYLKEKTEAGADFLITQLFFDNQVFYEFMEKVRNAGIQVPVCAGIMPITAASQIKRTVELSGSKVPTALSHLIAKYADNPDDLKKAGMDFAARQIQDLISHGTQGIHLYTMNKPDVAKAIYKSLHLI